MIQAPENISFGDLIFRRNPFIVPPYQRSYAWEKEEIEDFIKDIRALSLQRQKDKPNTIQQHFFGGVVCVQRILPNSSVGYVFDVVDGQQRLATFVLAISLIVKALNAIEIRSNELGDTESAKTAQNYRMQTVNNFLKYDEIEGGNLRQQLRLTLSKMDRAFFEQLIEGIQPTPQTESHKRLRAAREQLHQELIIPIIDDDGLGNAQKIERLLTLRSSLTDDCTVIRIVTDNIREAYRLFSVLNDRGSRLSDGDLLRSSTMEYLDSFAQRQANIEQAWDVILSKKRTQVDGFLRNYYSSLKGVRAPGRDLLDAYDEQILGTPQPPLDDQKASEIERVVLSMRIESEIHAIILEGEWPYQSPEASLWQQSRLGSVIGVLKHTLCIPLLLAAKAKLPESQFAEIVQLVERVAFRYIAMVGAHEGRLGEIYHRAAASIRTVPSEFSVDSLAQEMQSLIDRNAPSDLFRSALAAKLKYTDSSSQKRLVKYFLATIEEHYEWFRNGANGRPNPDTTMIWDINQLTIEHIYPRNSASLDTSLELLKNDLGNLSIWGPNENRGVGNAPFLEKKPRYQQSRMKINQQLALEIDWTTSRLQSRQSALLRNAEKLYKTRF